MNIDGVRPRCTYDPPTQDRRGRFVLEYWYKSGETVLNEKEARTMKQIFEQLVITYGFADGAK